jgi:hypothetical protein
MRSTEMSTRNISWGVKAAGAKSWNLTAFMCRLSWKLGASISRNPQGLYRPVMGLIFTLLFTWVRAHVCVCVYIYLLCVCIYIYLYIHTHIPHSFRSK